MVGLVFVTGTAGAALAQSQTTAPKEEKKTEKAGEMKKPAAHNASGTVKTAGADSLVVSGKAKGGKDAEWTFGVDSKTKIRKGGKDVAPTDLVAGDPVMVRYHEVGGKNVADSVMVRTAKKAAAAAPKSEAPKKDESKK
jgi:hypothetical protein